MEPTDPRKDTQPHTNVTPTLTPTTSVETLSLFERLASYAVIALLVLLPIFFIPSAAVPFQFTKTFLLVIGTLVIFALLVIARLKEGSLRLPYGSVVISAWLLVLAYVVSAFLTSGTLKQSFVGQGIGTDTAVFMLIGVLLLTLIPLIVRAKEHVLKLYTLLLVPFVIITLYQTLRLFFGADFLSFDIFTTSTANILGKWNDLGIFYGLTAILALITLEGLSLQKVSKIALYVILGISLLFLTVINFFVVWLLVGLFALGFFLYGILKRKFNFRKQLTEEEVDVPAVKGKGLSVAALVTLVISVLFVVGGTERTNSIGAYFEISQLEARPALQTTLGILKETYKDHAVFGSGPNTFQKQWATFKPQELNSTIFWNVDFSTGIGSVPTSFITTGVVGGIAWILFFAALLYAGFRSLIMRTTKNSFSYYLLLSSFISSVYLWIFAVVYTPNVVILSFAFIFTGIFVSALRHEGTSFSSKELDLTFADNPRLGFISVLVLTVFLIGTIAGLYGVGQQYTAALAFQKGVVTFNTIGSVEEAEVRLERAIRLSPSDTYHRFGAELSLIELNRVVSETEELTVEERRTQFQSVLADAISHGQRATELGKDNYQNWLTLGRVYQSVVPLQIEGAYDNAKEAYEEAQRISPQSPAIYLAQAELEVLNGSPDQARVHLEGALRQKGNYTAAIFLLSQLQIQAGELTQALASVEATTLLAPNNPVVFFQLGLLRFNAGDNAGAARALEQAVALNDVYANARYFLGLSYERLGEREAAIGQFERIEELNPENTEVKEILENLRAGNDPFAGSNGESSISPPIEGE